MKSNSVCVSMVPSGCFETKFDTTYPIQLKGIINQDEFRQSINRINEAILSNKILIIVATVFASSMIGGMIFIIVGKIIEANSDMYGFTTLLFVMTLGLIFFGIGCYITQFRYIIRIRQAIDEESIKYSSRSSIPCSWRLETTGNHHKNQSVKYWVIDIGHENVSENEIYYTKEDVIQPTLVFIQEDDYAPPPYSV